MFAILAPRPSPLPTHQPRVHAWAQAPSQSTHRLSHLPPPGPRLHRFRCQRCIVLAVAGRGDVRMRNNKIGMNKSTNSTNHPGSESSCPPPPPPPKSSCSSDAESESCVNSFESWCIHEPRIMVDRDFHYQQEINRRILETWLRRKRSHHKPSTTVNGTIPN